MHSSHSRRFAGLTVVTAPICEHIFSGMTYFPLSLSTWGTRIFERTVPGEHSQALDCRSRCVGEGESVAVVTG